MSKSFYLGFNWKMNPSSLFDSISLLKSYQKTLENKSDSVKIVAFVPSIFYYPLIDVKQELNLNLDLGVQDLSIALDGARTSEISAKMLSKNDLNTIIGHSEVRQNQKEDNQEIALKLQTAVKNQITPILCIGYSPSNSSDIDFDELANQITEPLNLIVSSDIIQTDIIIAYEPVWAIGSGKPATTKVVKEVNDFIESIILKEFPKLKERIKILYGGSINSKNILDFVEISNLDGFLIGGASLKKEEFESIVEKISNLG